MKKSMYLSVILIIMIGITSCSKKETSDTNTNSYKVRVEIVKQVAEQPDYYIGSIEESVSIPLSFLTTGMVEEVFVVEGQHVMKGQTLARLNNESYENAYQISLAKEKQAKDAYDRLSDLYKKGSLPEVKFVEIETGLSQAQAATQIARKNIQDCVLKAPIDGYIGKRSIEPGSNVIPANPVLYLVKIDKVFVKVSVPEKEISAIKTGQKALVIVPALNDESFEGKVAEKGVIANPVSHTYEVRISIENNNGKLMPGMVSKVSVIGDSAQTALVIPLQAVQIDPDGAKYVYKPSSDESGKVTKRAIETGAIRTDGVIVSQGLNPGDSIIVEGYQKLDENATIQIVR